MQTTIKYSTFYESQFQSYIEMSIRSFFESFYDIEILYCSGENENSKGYDIRVEYLFPLFFQVKRSYKILPTSTILDERKQLNLNDKYGAYAFNLHLDKKLKYYKQHNLLNGLKLQGLYSRYIAPLFYKKRELEDIWRLPSKAYLFDHVYYINSKRKRYMAREFLNFEKCFSIEPHRKIQLSDTMLHRYICNLSYEVSFHSEGEVNINSYDLIEDLNRTGLNLLSNESEIWLSPKILYNKIYSSLLEESDNISTDYEVDKDLFKSIYWLLEYLYDEYRINCILLSR